MENRTAFSGFRPLTDRSVNENLGICPQGHRMEKEGMKADKRASCKFWKKLVLDKSVAR